MQLIAYIREDSLLYSGLLTQMLISSKTPSQGFPDGTVVKNPPANAGNTGSSPGPGRSHVPRSN